jgi:hypothetical protein
VSPTEESHKILIAEMAKTPLTPDDIEAKVNIIRGARRLVPQSIEEVDAMRFEWVELLQSALENSDTFGPISEAWPV